MNILVWSWSLTRNQIFHWCLVGFKSNFEIILFNYQTLQLHWSLTWFWVSRHTARCVHANSKCMYSMYSSTKRLLQHLFYFIVQWSVDKGFIHFLGGTLKLLECTGSQLSERKKNCRTRVKCLHTALRFCVSTPFCVSPSVVMLCPSITGTWSLVKANIWKECEITHWYVIAKATVYRQFENLYKLKAFLSYLLSFTKFFKAECFHIKNAQNLQYFGRTMFWTLTQPSPWLNFGTNCMEKYVHLVVEIKILWKSDRCSGGKERKSSMQFQLIWSPPSAYQTVSGHQVGYTGFPLLLPTARPFKYANKSDLW